MTSHHTFLITGVPGVGKTSIANAVATNFQLPLINFGDILFQKIQAAKLGIQQVDQIRIKLPFKLYQKYQLATAKEIAKIKGNIIITSHLSIDTPTGFKPGFPQKVVDVISPSIIFVIQSPADEIRKRRLTDQDNRQRGQKLERWIEFHQSLNRALAANYAFYTGHYVYPVQNKQGQINACIQEINEVIGQILEKK